MCRAGWRLGLGLCIWLGLLACQPQSQTSHQGSEQSNTGGGASVSPESLAPQAPDDLVLPPGFVAQVFAEGVGPARQMAVRANGDVYLRLSQANPKGCIAALRDADGDGKAETQAYFHPQDCGTGLEIAGDWLYFSALERVYRQALPQDGGLVPSAAAEVLVDHLGSVQTHGARSLALDDKGHLYVNLGAPSNACQEQDRQAGSPGQDPCPLLKEFGGIYRFEAHKRAQDKLQDGVRFATGIRNAVALAWHPALHQLYLLQHGRDQLNGLFPQLYSDQDNAELPAEEFVAVTQGLNLGWPYCYYDGRQKQKVLAPEYGGDGHKIGRCADFAQPLLAFPAHYAPNDLIFYTGQQFPARYRNGALIAFHGSWNRGPLQQEGYQVVFVPFVDGHPQGSWEVFADGFAGPKPIRSPAQARYRPMGLALMPDGSLLVADSKGGRIWKIAYHGD